MNKLGIKGFSLIETLVAAAVIAFAVLSVVAIVRKGQEYTWVNLHRRTARAILDTTLEGAQFYPGNYGSIPASIASDSVSLDPTNGRPKAKRSFSITSGTVDIVAYKSITVKLLWQEYAGAAADSVVVERRVPDIPDSLRNIAPLATVSSPNAYFSAPGWADFSPNSAVDGIIGLHFLGEWASTTTSPTINLQWAVTHHVKKIVLYDRCNASCVANSADVKFYNGATMTSEISIYIPNCPNCGSANCSPGTAIFGPKMVTSISIQLSGSGSPTYVGLSEVQVFE